MARVVIVGDGPAGLSAAIFLARGGHEVTVIGADATPMHGALLHNFFGSPTTPGETLQQAAREQATAAGARLHAAAATQVEVADAGVGIGADDGSQHPADYLILAEGRRHPLADALGLELLESGAVRVDREQRTSRDRVYVAGRSTRPHRSQAVISAGEGAVAALDILAREAGHDVRDWDSMPK